MPDGVMVRVVAGTERAVPSPHPGTVHMDDVPLPPHGAATLSLLRSLQGVPPHLVRWVVHLPTTRHGGPLELCPSSVVRQGPLVVVHLHPTS